MQVRVKGLKIDTCLHTGKMAISLHYPISYSAYNVFKAVEEALGIQVVTIKKTRNEKEVVRHYCYWFIGNADSTVAIPALKKVQYELMLLSRRSKIESLKFDIESLEKQKQNYEQKL